MALVDEKDTKNMVLRTVFLPPALDDKLRDFAFENRVSKGDLIRSLVTNALKAMEGRSGSSSSKAAPGFRTARAKAKAKKAGVRKAAPKKVATKVAK